MPDSVVGRIDNLLPMLHADTRANLPAWSDSFLDREFRDGLREECRTAGVYVKRVNGFVRLRNGFIFYALPDDLLSIVRISIANVALTPSSQPELESLDEGFQYTTGTPLYWYLDRSEYHQIGFYPVPNAGVDGVFVDLIYHYAPCEYLEGHVANSAYAPLILGDLLELRTLAEAYAAETDMIMVETAQFARQATEQLYRPNFLTLYGESE